MGVCAMRVFVNIEDKRWQKYKIDFEKIANAAVTAVYKNSEVSITLVNDAEIKKINKEYRGINKPTNVLSFEALFITRRGVSRRVELLSQEPQSCVLAVTPTNPYGCAGRSCTLTSPP